jgi:glutaconate CoA-transferase subunit A
MIDKRCTIQEAIGLINSGDTIAIGGFTLYRRPVEFCRALALSNKKNLSIITLTAGIETDILVRENCVDSVRTCYAGLEILGRTPNLCKQAEEGKLNFIEETEYTLSYGVLAEMLKVPYLPCSAPIGETDFLKIKPQLKQNKHDGTLSIPAIKADVAIIHAQKVDIRGNSIILGQFGLDAYLPFISKKTIITTEKIIDSSEIEDSQISILQQQVDAIVEIPEGALPTSCYPYYPVDVTSLIKYMDEC